MKNQGGFTLVELAIVVAILGVVTAIAIPTSGMIKRHRLRSAAMELSSDLQKLRSDSITSGSPGSPNSRGFGIRFDSDVSYTLFEFDDIDNDYAYADNEAMNSVVSSFPSDVYMTKKDSSAIEGVVRFFDRRGMVRSDGWGIGELTILIRHKDPDLQPRCIVLSSVRVIEGVWNGSTNKCNW